MDKKVKAEKISKNLKREIENSNLPIAIKELLIDRLIDEAINCVLSEFIEMHEDDNIISLVEEEIRILSDMDDNEYTDCYLYKKMSGIPRNQLIKSLDKWADIELNINIE